MWSFQDQYNFFQSQAQDTNATNLTLGKKNINLGNKKVETALGVPPMEEERSYTTITTSNSYVLPERCYRIKELYVTIGTQRFYADPVYSDEEWRQYQLNTTSSSDNLMKVFPRPGLHTFEIYPTAATAGNTMKLIYESFSKDLSADDYTGSSTSYITTLANGGTAVTFSNVTLTASMAGRWLRPATDYNWYRIASITDSTHCVLQMPFQGVALAAATETFTIGELPRIPEGTHELPVYFALWQHFAGPRRDITMGTYYKALWDQGMADIKEKFGARFASAVIQSPRRRGVGSMKNPNDYPNLANA